MICELLDSESQLVSGGAAPSGLSFSILVEGEVTESVFLFTSSETGWVNPYNPSLIVTEKGEFNASESLRYPDKKKITIIAGLAN